jgi:hypothetical protein
MTGLILVVNGWGILRQQQQKHIHSSYQVMMVLIFGLEQMHYQVLPQLMPT